jgi:ArsR family transcriptional regulator
MKLPEKARYEARAKVIKALAHPARCQIVDELAKGPLCVCDIRDRVGSDLSTISRHLAVLKNVGILRDQKKGLQVFYSLKCPCVIDFFACAEKVLRLTGQHGNNGAGL